MPRSSCGAWRTAPSAQRGDAVRRERQEQLGPSLRLQETALETFLAVLDALSTTPMGAHAAKRTGAGPRSARRPSTERWRRSAFASRDASRQRAGVLAEKDAKTLEASSRGEESRPFSSFRERTRERFRTTFSIQRRRERERERAVCLACCSKLQKKKACGARSSSRCGYTGRPTRLGVGDCSSGAWLSWTSGATPLLCVAISVALDNSLSLEIWLFQIGQKVETTS